MTSTQVKTHLKITQSKKKAPLGDCLPPLDLTQAPRRKRRRTRVNETVPPCELLLDEHGTMAVAVGEQAVPVGFIGVNEQWPLPTELLLLLEPVLQPEVLAEVGRDDQ